MSGGNTKYYVGTTHQYAKGGKVKKKAAEKVVDATSGAIKSVADAIRRRNKMLRDI